MAKNEEDVMTEVEIKSIKHETPKAWLAIMEDDREIWFPKSQCELNDGVLSVPEWLMKEKGC